MGVPVGEVIFLINAEIGKFNQKGKSLKNCLFWIRQS